MRAPMTRRHKLAGAGMVTNAKQVKSRGQNKCSPWSCGLEIGCAANNPTPQKSTVTKPPEPMEEDHGRGPRPTEDCSASREELLSAQ